MKNITEIELIENLLKIGQYEKMHRINYMGKRIYIQETPFKHYSGLTGALSAATFKGDGGARRLGKWRESLVDSFGKQNFDTYMDAMAEFGTLTHESIVTIKENGKINWSEEEDKAWEYFMRFFKNKEMTPPEGIIRKMVFEYLQQVGSLLQFVYERVHEIYAIETMARWEELQIATPIDIFCSCRPTPKADFKKTTLNIKTSKQIGEEQLNQASCEMDMWNETYGDAEFTGIIRGKDWKDKPTFDMKVISVEDANIRLANIKPRLQLCMNDPDATYITNPVSKSFKGITVAGEIPEIVTMTLQEEWESRDENIS